MKDILHIMISLTLTACAVGQSPSTKSNGEQGHPTPSSTSHQSKDISTNDHKKNQDDALSLSLVREKINPHDLKITGLVAGLGRRGEAQGLNPLVGFVSYSVDARSDYIKYRACVQKSSDSDSSGSVSQIDGCHSGQTRFNEFILPVFVEGSVEVQAEACVDSERSTTQNPCGPVAVTTFQQPKNVDIVLQPLLNERNRYLRELEDISVDVENILREYQKNIQICEAKGSVNPQFKKLVSDYLAMGSSLIRMSSAYYGSPKIRPLLGEHAGEEGKNTEEQGDLQLLNESPKGVAHDIKSLGLAKKSIRQDHEKLNDFFQQFGLVTSLQLIPYQHSSYVRAVEGSSSVIGLVFSVEQAIIVTASIDILLLRSDEDIYGKYHSLKNPEGDPDNRPTCPIREKVVYHMGVLFGEPNLNGGCYSQGVPFKVNSADTLTNSSAGRSFKSCGLVMKIREKLEAVEEKIQKRCPTCLTLP
ncbi:MAG: hypothetical protein AB8C84_11860 [Oligoflexales bacterium]